MERGGGGGGEEGGDLGDSVKVEALKSCLLLHTTSMHNAQSVWSLCLQYTSAGLTY